MGNRGFLAVTIVAIFLTSLLPVSEYRELSDEKTVLFADSEPTLLISAGSSTGHVNGSKIESTPQGIVVAGDTRNNLDFGGIQLQATSGYNQFVDADSYVAMVDEQGVWQWAVMPSATQGLTFIQAMKNSLSVLLIMVPPKSVGPLWEPDTIKSPETGSISKPVMAQRLNQPLRV